MFLQTENVRLILPFYPPVSVLCCRGRKDLYRNRGRFLVTCKMPSTKREVLGNGSDVCSDDAAYVLQKHLQYYAVAMAAGRLNPAVTVHTSYFKCEMRRQRAFKRNSGVSAITSKQ